MHNTNNDNDSQPSVKGERIAKWLARAGVASRREAETMIQDGKISLNNEVVKQPATFVQEHDIIKVEGKVISPPDRTRLWRYHKPIGLITTHKDPDGRKTVFEAMPEAMPRVVSVGRLDLNSEGLLLLTNDGALARKLEMPSNQWTRRYRVRVFGTINPEDFNRLKKGITVEGIHYAPIDVKMDSQKGNNTWLTVSLQEGRNREIRRVMQHINLQVNRLIRIAYGPFQLGTLPKGALEEVTFKVIKEQIGLPSAEPKKK